MTHKISEEFKKQNENLWADVLNYINELLQPLVNHDLSDEEIPAYAIIDDFDAGHVGVFYLTRVTNSGELLGSLEDEEEDNIPFDMMTTESLISLANKLEKYTIQKQI